MGIGMNQKKANPLKNKHLAFFCCALLNAQTKKNKHLPLKTKKSPLEGLKKPLPSFLRYYLPIKTNKTETSLGETPLTLDA